MDLEASMMVTVGDSLLGYTSPSLLQKVQGDEDVDLHFFFSVDSSEMFHDHLLPVMVLEGPDHSLVHGLCTARCVGW